MFNDRWISLIFLMVLIGVVGQQGGMLMLAILLSTIIPVAWLWNRYALRRLEYTRTLSAQRVFMGETVDLMLQVTNRKILPLAWLRIEDEFPVRVTLLDEVTISPAPGTEYLVNLMSLRWYERVSWRYRLLCDQRGYHAFGPARLASGDLFGLFSESASFPQRDWLIVYPQVRPLPELGFPPKDPFGEIKARQRIFEDPSRTIGVRDYGPGDEFKRIHWKATARRQELQVKVYEPTTTSQLVLMVNIATLPKYWQGVIPERLERTLSVAASLASDAVERRYQVGVLANGCWPYSHQLLKVLPSRDPDQLMRILEALAVVSSLPTLTIEDLLVRQSPHLPWGATLAVVTSVVTEELLATMIALRDAGRRLVLVSLDADAPKEEIPGIVVHHLSPAQSLPTRQEEAVPV